MQRDGSAYLGMGIYTLGEASRLSGVSPQRIRRWLLGYSYNREGQTRSQVPVFRGQIPPFDSKLELGFRDLLEIRIVNAFADAGLGLPTIRKALDRASRLIDNDHPFSTARFRTDGRDIFLEIGQTDAEPILVDILKGQYAFRRIIEPSFKNLEFADGEAVRWWPLTRQRTVVVDPTIAFGQPIASRSGVPTFALASAVKAEGTIQRASAAYRVTIEEVRDAVEFERDLAA